MTTKKGSVEPEAPPLTVYRNGIDPLLVRLRAVHGNGGRPDLAPEIAAAARVWARRMEAAAALVPAA
jgi:hypothetical protein